ncbi:LPS export ABC transporter periplasmic protein LptC [hot springs metagenome]|uniref:LPS export ABC transporter periplasmic protein LptC n=1 Tax=hot springs metagenome TaxID=433727 RepID=A0A5J4L3T3_9ZZZZ
MKKILFVFASLFLLTVLIMYVDQEKDTKVKLRVEDNSYMDKVSITQKKAGLVKWILNAEKAVFLTSSDVKLDNLKIIFPEKELTLTSSSGMYDIESKNLKIDGNINAFTKDYEIVASTLFWDSSKNEILSDEKVQILGKRFFAQGDAMTATTDKATLNKNVKAIFYGK